LQPGLPTVSYVSQATLIGPGFAPRWKGTAALGWKLGPYSANVDERYVGRYRDYQDFSASPLELGNFWFCDANFRYDVGSVIQRNNKLFAGSYVTIGAVNLFNRLPQTANTFQGFDTFQADIRGRFLYAQFGVRL
jgi:hypothetical protein